MIRTYTELTQHISFASRYEYLKLGGTVGKETFGYDRWVNQMFYSSTEWRQMRHRVITRDLGLDMGVEGHEIGGQIYVHHMNPIVLEDLQHGNPDVLNPEYLISVSLQTHNAIHYGDERFLEPIFVERTPNDTIPWK